MIYDPGASCTVIPETLWLQLGAPALTASPQLYAYSDVPIVTLGSTQVWVEYDGRRLRLPVAVVKSQDSALFGLDWCRAWNMPLPKGVRLCKITSKALPDAQECTDIILKEFAEVFDTSKPGLMVDHPVQIHMNEAAVPKAFPARVVPLPLRKGVEEELQRLVERDIL